MDANESRPRRAKTQSVSVLLYRGVGIGAMGLAAAGAALPLLPTTPFLLVALWAFARGAPEIADRLRTHRTFGPYLTQWEERRAIPRPAKAAAVLGMAGSWTTVYVTSGSLVVAGALGVVLAAVGGYVVTRPSA